MKSIWTNDEIKYLKDNYNILPFNEIKKHLNKGQSTIYSMVKELGIGKQFQWNDEKIKILKEYYPYADWNVLFKKLGTTKKQPIIDKASELKIKRYTCNWTDEQKQFLVDNYGSMNIDELSKCLNKDVGSIYTMAYRMNLSVNNKWTDEEIKLLKEVYPIHSNDYLSNNVFTNHTINSIYSMAQKLHLIKDNEKSIKKYYDKNLILEQLKNKANEIGRTPLGYELNSLGLPSEKTFDRLFGTYRKAVTRVNLPINAKLYGNCEVKYATNGEPCFSTSELVITEYLISHGLSYIKEPYYKDYINDERCGIKRFDWKVGNYFIEYFGMCGIPSYDKKTKEKIKICQDNNINLIEIYPDDMFDLDEKLSILLN